MTTTETQQKAMDALEAKYGLCIGNDFHGIATGHTIVTMWFERDDADGFPVDHKYTVYPTGKVDYNGIDRDR